MCASSYKPTKLFTVDEANKMLPLVRAIVSDLMSLADVVIDRRQRLAHLTAGRDISVGDVYGDELAAIEKDLESDTRKLQEYVQELRDLGIEPKGPDGLVDFPSMMDGRLVYLCWKLGEPEVLWWHELEAGFSGRQPLTAGSLTAPDSVEGESLDG